MTSQIHPAGTGYHAPSTSSGSGTTTNAAPHIKPAQQTRSHGGAFPSSSSNLSSLTKFLQDVYRGLKSGLIVIKEPSRNTTDGSTNAPATDPDSAPPAAAETPSTAPDEHPIRSAFSKFWRDLKAIFHVK